MSQILTILHTESSLGWGGQENRTLNEMLTLREMGHRMLLACQPGAKLGIRAREAGFDVTEIRMRGVLDIPAILAFRRLISREWVQIVNTHSSKDTLIAGLAARSLFNRPRIVRTRHLALPITSRGAGARIHRHSTGTCPICTGRASRMSRRLRHSPSTHRGRSSAHSDSSPTPTKESGCCARVPRI